MVWTCKRVLRILLLFAGGNIAFGQQASVSNPGFFPGGTLTNNFILFGSSSSAYGWRAMTSADVNAATGCTFSGSPSGMACPGSVSSGTGSGATGTLNLSGSSSGTVTQTVANAAGTWTWTWPTGAGAVARGPLLTNGSGVGSFSGISYPASATSGGVPYFSSTSAMDSSAAGTTNSMMTWGGTGNAPISPTSWIWSNVGATNESVLFKNTIASGSTAFVIDSGASQAGPQFTVKNVGNVWFQTGFGINTGISTLMDIYSASTSSGFTGNANLTLNSSSGGNPGFVNGSNGCYEYSNAANNSHATVDTEICRAGTAGLIEVNNTNSAGTGGSIRLASYQSGGTKFTLSGCSADTTTGGASAGFFVSRTTGACAVTITINGATGLTAPTGWSCFISDETSGVAGAPTGHSATTVNLSVVTTSGDTVSWGCLGS